ncbi:MAG: NADH-quinone oxidoreductase subunit NuoK [Deltaproteobacteria bacterium]|nr:NADH-quinone oxidoreductase subunit NuoK [Deltaproteobacteria bacterium]
MTVSLQETLLLAAFVFSTGIFIILTRQNAIAILMGVELILNSVNINFVAFDRFLFDKIDGNIAAIINIMLAASEVAVALAIIIGIFRSLKTVEADRLDSMKG